MVFPATQFVSGSNRLVRIAEILQLPGSHTGAGYDAADLLLISSSLAFIGTEEEQPILLDRSADASTEGIAQNVLRHIGKLLCNSACLLNQSLATPIVGRWYSYTEPWMWFVPLLVTRLTCAPEERPAERHSCW